MRSARQTRNVEYNHSIFSRGFFLFSFFPFYFLAAAAAGAAAAGAAEARAGGGEVSTSLNFSMNT